MAFKMKPPFNINGSPVYKRELEEGCLGKGNKNGTILVSPDQTDEAKESVIEHEEVHIDQIKRGDLDYTHDTVTWKGKTVARQSLKEGAHKLPWEKEAFELEEKMWEKFNENISDRRYRYDWQSFTESSAWRCVIFIFQRLRFN